MDLNLFRKYLTSQEFEQKLNTRLERLQRAELNPVDRATIYFECQEDFFTFVNLFGVVLEPRLPESPDIPMFLWDYQREVIYRVMEAEKEGYGLLIEKSRDMGITWTILWYILWRWLFTDRWYCLIGSRKEEEVDNKMPSSLMGKLRYALYSLPKWMRPSKFKKSEHDIFCKLINPDRMSYVEGESANPNFGRGRRASLVFMDELFSWKFLRESWRSSTDTSPCRIAVSTPRPISFARNLRESFLSQGRLITLDWKKHPFKTEEWYIEETKRRAADPLSIKSELDISYIADPELAYYPEVMKCPIENFDYFPDKPLYLGLDFGVQDKTAIVYFQRDVTTNYFLDGIEKKGKPLYWYYPFLKKGWDIEKNPTWEITNQFTKEKFILHRNDYTIEEADLIKRFNQWKMPVMYCGEVAHRQKMIKSNTSVAQELAGIGIMLRINPNAINHPVRRDAVKRLLLNAKFSNKYGALEVYDALANSHFPISRDNSTSVESKDAPVHDEYADFRAAVENLAVNLCTNEGIKEVVYSPIKW